MSIVSLAYRSPLSWTEDLTRILTPTKPSQLAVTSLSLPDIQKIIGLTWLQMMSSTLLHLSPSRKARCLEISRSPIIPSAQVPLGSPSSNNSSMLARWTVQINQLPSVRTLVGKAGPHSWRKRSQYPLQARTPPCLRSRSIFHLWTNLLDPWTFKWNVHGRIALRNGRGRHRLKHCYHGDQETYQLFRRDSAFPSRPIAALVRIWLTGNWLPWMSMMSASHCHTPAELANMMMPDGFTVWPPMGSTASFRRPLWIQNFDTSA